MTLIFFEGTIEVKDVKGKKYVRIYLYKDEEVEKLVNYHGKRVKGFLKVIE